MPRIDPMSGVPVLTMAEFWQREAEHEGKEACEVIEDFYKQMAEAEAEDQQRLQDHALDILQDCVRRWNEYENDFRKCGDPEWTGYNFEIVAVEHVHECNLAENLRSSHSELTATVWCDDGKRRLAKLISSHESGSYWQPPEDEEELTFEEV